MKDLISFKIYKEVGLAKCHYFSEYKIFGPPRFGDIMGLFK